MNIQILTIIVAVLLIGLLTFIKVRRRRKLPESFLDSQSGIQNIGKTQVFQLCDKLREVLSSRYTDITPIAMGGMGLIAKGKEIKEDKLVAIKTILPGLEDNQKAIKLFFTEGHAIKKMNHPNIVKFYEVGEEEILYYIMEYLEGRNLKKVLREKKRLDIKSSLGIGTMAARALGHCHDNNIIHRDIKPSNIFITNDNIVKIIDFGIVKIVTGETEFNKESTKVGSPDYASPEQIQGQKISDRSDVYSLGVCLFHIISGVLPHKTSSILSKVLEEPLKLIDMRPDVPKELSNLIGSCIQIAPKERPTAMELWASLKKLV